MNINSIPRLREPLANMTVMCGELMSAAIDEARLIDPQQPDAAEQTRLLKKAIAQVQARRSFDFGDIDAGDPVLRDLSRCVEAAMATGTIPLPRETFAATARLTVPGSRLHRLVLVAAETDAEAAEVLGLDSLFFMACEPMLDGFLDLAFEPIPCSGRVVFMDGKSSLHPAGCAKAETPTLAAVAQVVFGLMGSADKSRHQA